MTDTPRRPTWLKAVADAARERDTLLPALTARGMGNAITPPQVDGRFVTFKRRLVSAEQAELDGIEWTLWYEREGVRVAVAAFRESVRPDPDRVAAVLGILKGWLVDLWSPDEAKALVGLHPRCQATVCPAG